MATCLSFSESFFTGEEDYYSIETTERPKNVLQAIVSLSVADKKRIAKEVFNVADENLEIVINSEMFDFDVLEKIRENDSCDGYCSPIRVYIDPQGWLSVTVY